MVIDPRLYQKLSGRSGDPYEKLGQALASQAARESARNQTPDDDGIDAFFTWYKMKWIISIVTSIIVLLVIGFSLLR